ncbi:MAG: DMT family transporter [Clostridia bacterium]|nr:DMT family transporter [Clostridia bacterium]
MNETHKNKFKLYSIAIICTMLWGSAIPTIKLGYDVFNIIPSATADKLFFAGVRFFGAGLLILVPYFFFHKEIQLTRKLCKNSLILGFIQTAGQYFFMYIGLAYTTGVNASVFNAVGTLLYVVLAWIVYRDEKLSKLKLIGCIIGFSGILLNNLATQKMGILSFKGDGFIIISNICVAVGFLYSKHSVKNSDPFLLTGIQMGIGGFILLAIGLFLGGRLPTITFGGLILLLYLMVVSSVAFSLWTLLLRDYSASLVGMFNFLTPVFGTIFSYILSIFGFLNETSAFTPYTILAIICSAAGILLSSLKTQNDEM